MEILTWIISVLATIGLLVFTIMEIIGAKLTAHLWLMLTKIEVSLEEQGAILTRIEKLLMRLVKGGTD